MCVCYDVCGYDMCVCVMTVWGGVMMCVWSMICMYVTTVCGGYDVRVWV